MGLNMKKLFLFLASSLLLASSLQAASHHKMVFLKQYDLDGDWELYREEFNFARQIRFKRTDENNDGFVSADEYLFEYQNKLDNQLANDRKGQIEQTTVRFKALDKNENGRMEWAEYTESGERAFNRYDSNQDRQIDENDDTPKRTWRQKSKNELTREQWEAQRNRQLGYAKRALRMPTTHNKEGMLTKYDTNQDKVITLQEHSDRRRIDFERTDEDSNGWVSEQEYLFEYQDRMDSQIEKTRAAAIKQTTVRFNALDKDGDGAMTFAEYQASGNRFFERFDTNADEVITMDEAAPKKYQSKANQTDKKGKKQSNKGDGY